MKHLLFAALIILLGCAPPPAKQKPPVRVAVIAAMMQTGLWPAMAKQFETDTGYTLQVTVTGNRQALEEGCRKGAADFITMHGSDEAASLVADGFTAGMTPWARNELVIVGPVDDPAGVRGMTNGAAALRQIADTHASYVDYNDQGSRQIAGKLWKKSGVNPQGDWVIKDESAPKQILTFARERNAYVIIGRAGMMKKDSEGLDVLVRGDAEMRRTFVVMVVNVKRFPLANVAGAQALADYLTSKKGQNHLRDFAAKQPVGAQVFFPVAQE